MFKKILLSTVLFCILALPAMSAPFRYRSFYFYFGAPVVPIQPVQVVPVVHQQQYIVPVQQYQVMYYVTPQGWVTYGTYDLNTATMWQNYFISRGFQVILR